MAVRFSTDRLPFDVLDDPHCQAHGEMGTSCLGARQIGQRSQSSQDIRPGMRTSVKISRGPAFRNPGRAIGNGSGLQMRTGSHSPLGIAELEH
jgi:hypothetical protein